MNNEFEINLCLVILKKKKIRVPKVEGECRLPHLFNKEKNKFLPKKQKKERKKNENNVNCV